jgi:hypothetical protein
MTRADIPESLAEELRPAYRKLLQKPTLTRQLLTAKVRRYLGTISEVSDEQNLDVGTASDLGAGLLRLLCECEEEDLRHVQVAVNYFLDSEDMEPDLTSPHGFDDDAKLFNAVCSHLGKFGFQVVL